MSGWWWLPIGLVIWLVAGLLLALIICPVLRRNSHPLDR